MKLIGLRLVVGFPEMKYIGLRLVVVVDPNMQFFRLWTQRMKYFIFLLG